MTDLTPTERSNLRAALAFLRSRAGTWATLAKALHVSKTTAKRGASASLVFRVAKLAKVGVDDVLQGRFPGPNVCPHCGQKKLSVVEDALEREKKLSFEEEASPSFVVTSMPGDA